MDRKRRSIIIGRSVLTLDEIGSTNDEAHRLLKLGYGEGTVVIAHSQTKGRGRLDRRWLSPLGGLYLSIILKPYKEPSKLSLLTNIASLAVVRTIKGLTRINAELKWPNDILISDRKVGGVLCEGSLGAVIVGIGVNINTHLALFPATLKKQVTSLKFESGESIDRERFTGILLEEFNRLYEDFLHHKEPEILSEWISHCGTIGRQITVYTNKEVIHGHAMDIGPRGELIVKCLDGKIRKIFTADAVKVSQ